MGTRIFNKPDIKPPKSLQPLTQESKQVGTGSEIGENESYKDRLEKQIFELAREVESEATLSQEKIQGFKKQTLDAENAHNERVAQLRNDLNVIVLEIEVKTLEHKEFDKPYFERERKLNEREAYLNDRDLTLNEKDQAFFERDRAFEVKLEGVQELADELGETRVRQASKERFLQKKEESLNERETKYMVDSEKFTSKVRSKESELTEREGAVALREIEQDAKEQNLSQREDALGAPLNKRRQELNDYDESLQGRERVIMSKENKAQEREQGHIKKERELREIEREIELDTARAKTIIETADAREREVSIKEGKLSVEVSEFANKVRFIENDLDKREHAVNVRELGLDAKEQNLIKREEANIREGLLINSKRQALMGAQKQNVTTSKLD